MKLYLTIIKFVFIGILFIISNENLQMADPNDRAQFIDSLNSWKETILSHVSQITSFVINSEWLPEESKNKTALEPDK